MIGDLPINIGQRHHFCMSFSWPNNVKSYLHKNTSLCIRGSCRTLFIARSSLFDGVTCSMVCMSVLASAVVDLMQSTKSGDAFVNVKPCVSCETFRGEER